MLFYVPSVSMQPIHILPHTIYHLHPIPNPIPPACRAVVVFCCSTVQASARLRWLLLPRPSSTSTTREEETRKSGVKRHKFKHSLELACIKAMVLVILFACRNRATMVVATMCIFISRQNCKPFVSCVFASSLSGCSGRIAGMVLGVGFCKQKDFESVCKFCAARFML